MGTLGMRRSFPLLLYALQPEGAFEIALYRFCFLKKKEPGSLPNISHRAFRRDGCMRLVVNVEPRGYQIQDSQYTALRIQLGQQNHRSMNENTGLEKGKLTRMPSPV